MSITPKSLEAAWEGIRARIPQAEQGGVLEQSLLHGEVGLSAIVRVCDLMPGVIIRVPCRWVATKWQSQRLAGVHFETILRDRNELILPVMLADADALEIFAVFAADLASIISSAATIDEKMLRFISRTGLWKRFFQKRVQGLSEEEIRGLIGELEILGKVIRGVGPELALDAWRGPFGDLHDFHLPALRIEVKTWANASSPRIFISDPAQIVFDEAWPVWIAAVQLSKDNVAGTTLSDRVNSLLGLLNTSQRELVESLLADVGYISTQAEIYTKKYSVRETMFYRIDLGFPYIDPAIIPPGISYVKYALELGAIVPFSTPSPI